MTRMTKIRTKIYDYRWDIVGIMITILAIHWSFDFLMNEGLIVFSDIDFPFDARDYLNQIIGVWNFRYNTTSMLNTPRLLSILPAYIISYLTGNSGGVFLKVFLFQNIYLSALTFYLFAKRILRVYYNPVFGVKEILIVVFGSLYYGLNPWLIFRIQHIYLLVGYSVLPLALLQFFKLYDHKFQSVVVTNYDEVGKLPKQNIIDAILLGLIISYSAGAIHYFFYIALLFIGLIALLLLKYTVINFNKGLLYLKQLYVVFIKKSLLLGAVTIGFSGYWLFIYLGSIVMGTQASQNNINVLDTYTSFSQNSDILSVLFGVSYWWPMVSMSFLNELFYISGSIILLVALYGICVSFHRHHIILFLGLLGAVMAVLATGVYYMSSAELFLLFVDLPVIGSVFRDPNKLVGILVICIAMAFVVGNQALLIRMEKLKSGVIFKWCFILAVGCAVFFYISAMKTGYSEQFYNIVERPDAYESFYETYEQASPYVVYLPLAEDMLQVSKIATPYWNKSVSDLKKATGDVHIYNSPFRTLFHHEGNDLAIGYYLRYLQHLLDEKRTNQLEHYIRQFGSKTLVYHSEFIEQESRQLENLEQLNQMDGMALHYENDIFSLFTMPELSTNASNTFIYTSNGLEVNELYKSIEGYDPLQVPKIYAYQDMDSQQALSLPVNKIIDIPDSVDYWMQWIDAKHFIYPFEWINEGNPYIKWGKTYVTSTDWQWYMQSQNFIGRDFNFDYNGGLAVTFAPNALNVLPYEKKHMQGKLVLDFNTMLSRETFFVADNPELFDIKNNPYTDLSNVQTIEGVLTKGDPKDIWQVAKSGYLDAEPGTPYQFELLMSGRFIDGLHVKVRFYDEDKEELGIAYVVSPDEAVNFDTVKFTGEVIADRNARYMRIDLLTFQKPDVKSYWWIHDANIYELSDYVSENTIDTQWRVDYFEPEEAYKVYARVYLTRAGGQFQVKVNDNAYTVDALDTYNHFEWMELGDIELTSELLDVELTAFSGFNAVNALAIISEQTINTAKQASLEVSEDSLFMVTREHSLQMEGYTQLQSDKTNAELSYGKGVDLALGHAYVEFDIMKSGTYNILNDIVFPHTEAYVDVSLYKEGAVIHSQRFEEGNDDLYDLMLESGSYRLLYEVDAKNYNYAPLLELKPFDTSEVDVEVFLEDAYMSDCSECEKITIDMMSHELDGNQMVIQYDKTCSCDWYIYSSPHIDVISGDEWYVKFNAQSEYIRNRHGKFIFLDGNDNPIGYTFVNEVEEHDKVDKHTYEQIIEVPDNAVTMYLQFWARGSKTNDGWLYIEDLNLYKYDEMITLDHMILIDNSIAFDDMKTEIDRITENEGQVIYDRNPNHPVMLNTYMSPNQFFEANNNQMMIKLNGITAGYLVKNGEQLTLKAKLFTIYVIGLILFGLTSIISLWFILFHKERTYEKNSGS